MNSNYFCDDDSYLDLDYVDERWEMIRNFPRYLVSDFGRVIDRNYDRLAKLHQDPNSYLFVCLSNGRETKYAQVQNLVADAFLDRIPNSLIVQHIDGDKTYNLVENLEIVIPSDSYLSSRLHGLTKMVRCVTIDDVFPDVATAAEAFGVYPSNMLHHLKDDSSTIAGGYVFEYITPHLYHIRDDLERLSSKRRTNQKTVRCVETGDIYASMDSAAKCLGVLPNSMSRHLNGWRKSIRGFTFEYVNDR